MKRRNTAAGILTAIDQIVNGKSLHDIHEVFSMVNMRVTDDDSVYGVFQIRAIYLKEVL